MLDRSALGKRILFLRACLWLGVVADLLATLPLLFPEIAKLMFGLQTVANGNDYLYVSRIGAALMLGWTCLLAWGSHKPIERKGVILLTVIPVLLGLLGSSILTVQAGHIQPGQMLPMWIFYALIIPLYVFAYAVATGIEKNHFPDR